MNIFQFVCKALFLLLVIAASGGARATALGIEWEIGNRFRMFDYIGEHGPANARTSSALFQEMAPRKDEDTDSWLKRVVALRGSPYLANQRGAWIEDHRGMKPRYQEGFADAPAFYAVKARLPAPIPESIVLQGEPCVWRMDGQVIATSACTDEIASDVLPGSGALLEVSAGNTVIAREQLVPTVKIVLGLGDSYAAGEGAPDVPTVWKSRLEDEDWMVSGLSTINSYVKADPVWLSQRCNRSFYSYQHMVALRLAADNPHSTVAFIHLACAGAEIVDGLLAPQRTVPGMARKQCEKRKEAGMLKVVDAACDTPVSQLTAAVDALCKKGAEPLSDVARERIAAALLPLRHQKNQLAWINELHICPDGQLRQPDLVLLSIGGNDIGFSGVIKWAILPSKASLKLLPKMLRSARIVRKVRREGGVVCPFAGAVYCEEAEKFSAVERIGELPRRFIALDAAFKTILNVDTKTVVLNTYPNPLEKADGTMCGDDAGTNTRNAWYMLRLYIPEMLNRPSWQFNLTESEAGVVNKHVIPKLTNTLTRSAGDLGWRIAAQDRVMQRKGWCTGNYVDLLGPASVEKWEPYQDNMRLIRTGADSFLTQWPADKDRWDGLMGAFHPNAQGYAGMADAVIATLKK